MESLNFPRPSKLYRANSIIDYDSQSNPIYADIIHFKNGKINVEKMFQYKPEDLEQLLLRKNLMIKHNEIILISGITKCNICYTCINNNEEECYLYNFSKKYLKDISNASDSSEIKKSSS